MKSLLSGRSISLGSWFGFQVRIHYSWFVIFLLVLWTFSASQFPRELPGYGGAVYVTMGVVATLLFFLSVLLHELSHSAMARRRGIDVEGITLFIFGGVAQTRMEADRAVDEFLLTVVGPLSSVALAGAFYLAEVTAGALGLPAPVRTVAGLLAFLNLVLAVFNMIPGFPLDGGRIFRSAVWHFTGDLEKATRWATRGGQGFGYLLMAYGAWLFFNGIVIEGMWSAFIGWFLSTVAAGSYRQFRVRRVLAGVPVARVMTPEPVAVSADSDLKSAVEDHFLRRSYGGYPVVEDGRVVGLLSLDDVTSVARRDWPLRRVREVMRGLDAVPVVAPEDSLEDVLSALQEAERDRVLVVEDGHLRGVITMEEINRWVQRLRQLGLEEGVAGEGPGAAGGPGSGGGAGPEDGAGREGSDGGRRPGGRQVEVTGRVVSDDEREREGRGR